MPTLRQKIISLLIDEEMSAREISGEVGISEKEVYGHLSHIARSVASRDKKIVITPARSQALYPSRTLPAMQKISHPESSIPNLLN
jgi:predicted Zn-ribbon and HTH transcriptional regulator